MFKETEGWNAYHSQLNIHRELVVVVLVVLLVLLLDLVVLRIFVFGKICCHALKIMNFNNCVFYFFSPLHFWVDFFSTRQILSVCRRRNFLLLFYILYTHLSFTFTFFLFFSFILSPPRENKNKNECINENECMNE